MNWLNCDRPKKSRITALRAFGLISFCGIMPSMLTSNSVIRSLTRRSVRANRTHPTAAQMVDVIKDPLTLPQGNEILHCSYKIFLGQRPFGEINFNSEL